MASYYGENFVKYSKDRRKQVPYTVKSVTNNNSFKNNIYLKFSEIPPTLLKRNIRLRFSIFFKQK